MGRKRRVLTPGRSAVHRWGAELRARRDERGLSLAALGRLARYDVSYLGRLERGERVATLAVAQACDRALGAGGELVRLWQAADRERRQADSPGGPAAGQATAGQPVDEAGRELVAIMPLHAITAMYGEAGLRARFAAEIARLPDSAGTEQARRALQLAGQLHAADRRQREPYVNHLLRVALRITCHYGVGDTDVICAALLHDAVEDHAAELAPGGGRDGALAALAAGFGPRVAGLVGAVTNPKYAPGVDRDEQYRAHLAGSLRPSSRQLSKPSGGRGYRPPGPGRACRPASPRSRIPSAAATTAATSAGSRTAASSASHTPSANRPATRSATSPASRVLPAPPGPVTVTSRY